MLNYKNAALIFILIAGLLGTVSYLRMQDYRENVVRVSEQSVRSGSAEVARVISELRRRISLFASERSELLLALAEDRSNDLLYRQLVSDLHQHFPNFFAVTLASSDGETLLEGLDDLVGKGCRRDIKAFSGHLHDHGVYVHGSPRNNPHHFDVMVPFVFPSGEEGVFFVSFYANMLATILKSIEVPGHNLYLTVSKPAAGDAMGGPEMTAEDWFVEVSALGARDVIARDLLISTEERQAMLASAMPEGTRWRLIDVPNADVFAKHERQVVLDSLFFGLVLLLLSLAVLWQTERVASMRQRQEEMERAHRSKAEFISTISHEFRTPMNSVINMSRLALDTDDEVRRSRHIESALSSANVMMRLIEQTLDFSDMDAGRLDLKLEPFAFSEWLEQSTLRTEREAERKGLIFSVVPDDDIPEGLSGDPTRLAQVLDLLADNAVKFTETGGDIRLGVRKLEEDEQSVQLRFAIRDTGVGMRKEDQARIFGAIGQADSSDSRQFGGIGLGLVICRGLVHLMGGELHGESEYGVGSCFYFSVRLNKAAQPLAGKPKPLLDEPKPPLQVISSGSSDEDFDREVAEALLITLAELIAAYDTEAEQLAAEVRAVVPAQQGERLGEIENALARYDFDRAEALLAMLRKELGLAA